MSAEEMEDAQPAENEGIDLDRLHIQNIPRFIGFKQFRKLLEKNLGTIKLKKCRHMSEDAYVSFESPEDAQQALKILDGLKVKKSIISAKLAVTEVKKFNPTAQSDENGDGKPIIIKTAKESVTPLADIPYEEQLRIKDEKCLELVKRLFLQMSRAQIQLPNEKKPVDFLRKIKPSPKIKHYRNKCEFTVGKTLNSETCVGFVGGRFSRNQHYVIPIDGVENITNHCKTIVEEFEKFVISSNLPPFDEFARSGVWKMLTIREFSGDVMLIVTVFPLADPDQEEKLKKEFAEQFLDLSTFEKKGFRVTSIYWHSQANSSDPINFEHVSGAPYIYETVMDCRFRVSPSAFFQTNSQAASVLYKTIGEACGLTDLPTSQEAEHGEEPASKKLKIEEETHEMGQTILLDICCGTGTIGQCLMKNYNGRNNVYCIGVEIIASAVEDAKQNAKDNGIHNAKYIAGKAEDTFRNLRYHLPPNYSLQSSNVVGVLDPPRAGMHEKVILGCREMSSMKKLIFVSCDPSAAMKNIIDLCRPESKKFYGSPFSIECIQPVDMFPQTNHFEWVITLAR